MIAIQRTPAPTPSAALPSWTSEKANTSTQDTAKNSVVYASSRLRTSTVRSLLTISQIARSISASARSSSDDAPVSRSQRVGRGHRLDNPTVTKEQRVIEKPLGQVEVVRREDHDGAAV